MKRIPISAARHIAKTYGYDQVIIIGRSVAGDESGQGEHVTTYGINREHCRIAAKCGNFLKNEIMGWKNKDTKGWTPKYTPKEEWYEN